jgi:hypothetical protein
MNAALTVIKQLGSYAAVLYAFGFLAVHARLNALGVWSRLPLLDEQYLTEGAIFLVATLRYVLFPFGLTLLILAALILICLRWVPAEKREKLRARVTAASGPLQVVALLVIAFFSVHFGAAELATSGLLLQHGSAMDVTSMATENSGSRTLAFGSMAVLTFSAIALARWMFLSAATALLFRAGAAAVALLSTVLLPFNFAVLLRTAEFPLATLSITAPAAEVQGALLFRGSDQVVFYDMAGEIVSIPADRVREVRISRYVTLQSLRSEASP